ncbi:MAG: hypothetical protein IT459_07145 [Planctomycetes bacterium]|nr:hypothetical protein [Planctomycetota bacterium]
MHDRSVAVLESSLALRPSSALPPVPTIDVGSHEDRCGRLLAGLGLELGALRDRTVVDVHGMGSLALGAALAGAQVWSIPLDEARGEWTARWFQRQRKTLRLTTDLEVVREADLVVFADGDAPMHDPIARLPRVLGALGPGAHAVVFVPERHARLRSVLRLRVLGQIAHGRDEIARAASRLFPRFVAAWSSDAARRSNGTGVLDRVTGPLPLLPTRAEVLTTITSAGCTAVAVDPSAGLAADDDRLDAIWSTWPHASDAAAAELMELERRITSRDYDEQHLRMLDAPDELDRVAFCVRRIP